MTTEEENKLIEDNLKLVYDVVHKFYKNNNLSGWDKEDFISEGYIGLIQAAKTYNPSTKYRFSTFAYNCIYHQLCRIYQTENAQKRKASNGNLSLEYEILENPDLTLQTCLGEEDDYTSVYVNDLLDIIDKFRTKDSRFVIQKITEGYNQKEIAEMLGTSAKSISQKIKSIRKNLQKLEVIQQ